MGKTENNTVNKLPSTRERVDYLDALRVIAIVFVLMIHTIFQSFNNMSVHSWEWQTMNIYDSISRWSVPVFVMISGALFLDGKKPFKEILKKNVLRLVTAYLFWTLIYAILCQIYYNNFDSTLNMVLKGHYHMWFILMIIGLYLVTPLLRKIVEEKSLIRLFLILALIFAFFLPDLLKTLEIFRTPVTIKLIGFINNTKTNMYLFMPLGYTGYFVLGYVLYKFEISKKLEWIIYLLGIAGLAYTILATAIRSNASNAAYVGYYDYQTTNVAAMSAAVFVFFKKHYRVKNSDSKFSKAVRTLSGYSFGVYLVHMVVIDYMTTKLHFTPSSFNPIISVPIICLITVVVSFAISAVLNSIKELKNYIV